MSYFVFGFIDLGEDAPRLDDQRQRILSCGLAEGVAVGFGDKVNGQILDEMRGPYLAEKTYPFLLTQSSDEDTSDGLVSPHLSGLESTISGIERIGRWLACTLRSEEVDRVRIWLTEGYDNSFEDHHLAVEEFSPHVIERVTEEGDVPSLRLTIAKSPTKPTT